jgi:hypothetical protein
MKRADLIAVAAIVGLAAVVGLVAVTRTTHLGASSRKASDARIAARIHQLDRFEASLARALHSRPPALPHVPKAHAPAVSSGAAVSAAPRIVYQRPAPHVVVLHRHQGDDGGGEGGGGDGGGGDA